MKQLLLIITVITVLITLVIPVATGQVTLPVPTPPVLISLANFSEQVTNGNSEQITGLYSNNLFALNVLQQPSGNAGYVSTTANSATQFGGSSGLGFLAHNYLSGALFSYLYSGSLISVIFGDGHIHVYKVLHILRFQALTPESVYSDFTDLSSGVTFSSSDMFYSIYGVADQLVLQTCISYKGLNSWGRLFIIATQIECINCNIQEDYNIVIGERDRRYFRY